jgi:folylpolyglutamate synthase/dihydropteroate synthase
MQELITGAGHLTLTTFTVNRITQHPSLAPTVAAAICDAADYMAYDIVMDPAAAFTAALARPEPIIVVAGSFFLLNHIRPLLK